MITHNWIQINIYKLMLMKSAKPQVDNLLVTMQFMWHVTLQQLLWHNIPKNNYSLNYEILFCYCVVSFCFIGKKKSVTADPYSMATWLFLKKVKICEKLKKVLANSAK